MYFWDKYQSSYYSYDVTTYTNNGFGPWSGTSTKSSENPSYGYPGYGFDSSSGFYTTGSYQAFYTSATLYRGGGTSLEQVNIYDAVGGVANYQTRTATATASTSTYSGYQQGSYIETITAAKDAYVNNARNSDGYWYVRRLPVPPVLTYPNGGEAITGLQTITWSGQPNFTYEIQLTTDNGSTWKTIVANTAIGASSYEHNFTNENQSSLAKIRIRANDSGTYSIYDISDGVFTIQHNLPPIAPTKLSPKGTVIDRTKVRRFSWQHNDPNTNDTQSSAVLEWKTKGGSTWNTINVSGNSEFYDVSANIFPVGENVWRVKTYDQAGLVSPVSEEAIFTAAEPSDAPVIVSPSTLVPIARPTVQWSSGTQTSYQIVIDDVLGANVWDSGEVISGNKARTIDVDLLNGGQYVLKVRIKNGAGLWTENAILQMTVSYTPPAKPELELFPSEGSIIMSIGNPTPTGTQPVVTGNDIYKRIDGEWVKIAEGVLAQYRDLAVASGKMYEYYIRANGENTTFSDSDIETLSITFKGVWLHDVTYPEGTVYQFKYDGGGRSSQWEVESSVMRFKGRKYPVIETSEMQDDSVSFQLALLTQEETETLKKIVYARNILCYRDGRGRLIYGMITRFPLNDETWRGQTTSLEIMRVDFKEGV
ncbi:hypothetical protein AABM38_20440 [Heyndrickxia sp. MSNUG]|uniref:hypothetical protein n=1 Tax=Heyndrickxia sp. MSNUG TaxID=3136677 RepID=UPI003C2C616D